MTEARATPGLTLEILWLDDEAIEVRLRAANGRFSGTVECYAPHTAPRDLAATIEGFPRSAGDRREFVLGTFDAGFAGGGCRLALRCRDRSAHAVAEIELRAHAQKDGTVPESAEFAFPVEAGAIDQFVAELLRMRLEVGSIATLRAAT